MDRLRSVLTGRYTLERELGRGGMATVYLAQDLRHKRRVAIKVVRPELAAVLGPERFLREIEITAQLNHPHILPLLDSGEAEGSLFYATPYAEGESLRERLSRETQLPVEDALKIAREVADGLDYAHRHGVVHRDIKPENVLLESGHAVIADFGIARAISAASGEKLTATGVAVGTPEYMSPEQASGRGELDGRSDIYALGCVLYEMLAGQPPFIGPTADAVLRQHLTAEAPVVTAIRAGVPASVTNAICSALAKAPADRFSSAARFAAALVPRGATGVRQAERLGARVRAVWGLVLSGVAAVAIAGTLLLLRHGRAAPGPESRYPQTAIAVLPFENLSAEGPYAYFARGLQDEILTQLTKVAALKVISRTSVMGYAGQNIPPLKQIARELGVGSVVEASVQVVGGRLRVNVQLVDAATDAHVWAERYDRALDDAFAIQSDVAQQIVAAVGAALGGAEQEALAQAPTGNAEAYLLYLQGRDYQGRPSALREDLEIAQQFFERALALDPDFALAHAALADVHGSMYTLRYDPSPARMAREVAEAEAALRLAPDLPQAHLAMTGVYFNRDRDYPRILAEYRIALSRLPNDAGIWAGIGAIQARMGHWEDAIAAYRWAQELNPRDPFLFYMDGALVDVRLHRYAEAVQALDRALILAPDLYDAAVSKALIIVWWKGQLDTLRALVPRLPRDRVLWADGPATWLHLRLLLWGRQADSVLQVLGAARLSVIDYFYTYYPSPLLAAWAYQLRGDRSAARAAFDSALVVLDSVIRQLPDDWRLHAARGLALAGLSRREEAVREARWLQQSFPYREDAAEGPSLAEERARILAQAGDSHAALDEIERLLAGPSLLSVHTLRLDPLWDPLRSNPRFQALLAEYEK